MPDGPRDVRGGPRDVPGGPRDVPGGSRDVPRLPRPPRSRWTSFVADSGDPKARTLHEEANPAHRVRVEHNRDTLLIHLSGEDGRGWTVLAVDRATRRWAVGEGARQLDAAREAFDRLYPDAPG